MKGSTTKSLLAVLMLFQALLCAGSSVLAQEEKAGPGPAFQAPSDRDIQLMRKDIRSQRKQLIAANLKLTDAESEKFWPIYDKYVDELVSINNTKYALLRRYTENDTMTDQEAEDSVGKWIGVDQSVAQLRLRYVPIVRKVLSPRNTALFFQLDRRIQLMIDLQLVSLLPLIEP